MPVIVGLTQTSDDRVREIPQPQPDWDGLPELQVRERPSRRTNDDGVDFIVETASTRPEKVGWLPKQAG